MDVSTPLTDFPGVGEARAKALARLGLRTAGDLVGYFPRSYEDRRAVSTLRDAPEDAPVCIRAMVAQPPTLSRIRRGLELANQPAV